MPAELSVNVCPYEQGDITTSLEVDRGSLRRLHKCDVEARNLQFNYTDSEFYSRKDDILYPAVKPLP